MYNLGLKTFQTKNSDKNQIYAFVKLFVRVNNKIGYNLYIYIYYAWKISNGTNVLYGPPGNELTCTVLPELESGCRFLLIWVILPIMN